MGALANGKFVAYYRVSTAKQGESGLGLEAQRDIVRGYVNVDRMVDGRYEVTEIESGKRNDRPPLLRVLALCRVHNATLVIAKLDRRAYLPLLVFAHARSVACQLQCISVS